MEQTEDSKPLITLIILYLIPLAGIGIDIYTPSLPAIVQYFSSHPASVKITLAVYLLGYGLGQPIFGTISDSWGRKKPLAIGLVLYLIAAWLCTLAPSIGALIGLRFLQGMAVAAPGSIAKSILSDSFEGKQLFKKATYVNVAWALGPIVAPGIGGYLQYFIGWQACFYFLVFYSLLALLLVLFFYKETNQHIVPFRMKETLGAYKEMLSHSVYMSSAACMSLIYGMIILFNIVGPFVIQVVLHHNAITFGHIAFVMGFAFFLGSLTNRFLLRKKEAHQILPIGISIMIAVSLLMVFLSLGFPVNVYLLTVPTFLIIYGAGLIFPNTMAKALSLFRHRGGVASALMGGMFVIGTSIMAVIGSFLKTHSLVPIAASYFVLVILVFLIYFFIFRKRFAE